MKPNTKIDMKSLKPVWLSCRTIGTHTLGSRSPITCVGELWQLKMTTITQHRKTFAEVSAANSFAGIAFVLGGLIGIGAALSELALPGLSTHAGDWGINFLIGGLVGACTGWIIGTLADRLTGERARG
jgi:hypothetical protein